MAKFCRVGKSIRNKYFKKCLKPINRFLAWLRWRNNKNFLKKNSVLSWWQYRRKTDPFISGPYCRGSVRQWYHGYPYVITYDPTDDLESYHAYLLEINTRIDWCRTNCTGRVRFDSLMVLKDEQGDDWLEHSMGNERMFFAFTEKDDFMLFCLKF
jgi:hypothetical protein